METIRAIGDIEFLPELQEDFHGILWFSLGLSDYEIETDSKERPLGFHFWFARKAMVAMDWLHRPKQTMSKVSGGSKVLQIQSHFEI